MGARCGWAYIDTIASRANAKSFDRAVVYVIASVAKQSPIPRIEIASSLRSSQRHQCDLPSDFALALPSRPLPVDDRESARYDRRPV